MTADIYSPPTEQGKALYVVCLHGYLRDVLVLDRQAIVGALPDALNNILLTILTHTSSEQGRQSVPPIRTAGVLSPFAYKIEVKVDGVEYGGTGD